MDELVKLVSEKTGLSEDMSKVAIETVLNYLKDKLPVPIGTQIDNVLAGKESDDLGAKLGGLFGE